MGKGALTAAVVVALCLGVLAPVASAADTRAPQTDILVIADVSGGRYRVMFFPNEPVSAIDCRVDERAYVPCMGAGPGHDWIVGGLMSGLHTVQIRSTDVAGNVEDPPVSRTFYSEPQAPTISSAIGAVPGTDTWTTNSTPTFSFSSPDPRVTSYACSLDDENIFTTTAGAGESCGSTWTPPAPLSEGHHKLYVRAIDEQGVSSAWGRSYDFGVDTRPPTASLIAPGRVPAGTPVKVRIQANDENHAERTCLFDGRPIRCRPHTFKHLKPGPHKVYVHISDPAGSQVTERARIFVSRH